MRNILKNARHSSGHDLYSHLVEVMNHIVMHCPENGLDKFEEISYLLKQKRDGKIENLSEFLMVSEERPYSRPGKDSHGEHTINYLLKAKKFFDVSYIKFIKKTASKHQSVKRIVFSKIIVSLEESRRIWRRWS